MRVRVRVGRGRRVEHDALEALGRRREALGLAPRAGRRAARLHEREDLREGEQLVEAGRDAVEHVRQVVEPLG